MKKLVLLPAIFLAGLIMSISYGIFTNPISAQGDDLLLDRECANAPWPMPPIMPGGFTGKTNTTLVFDYGRGGGFAPPLNMEKIFYNSLSHLLVVDSAMKPPVIKVITGPEQHCLEGLIGASKFFEAKSDYPPVQGAADFFNYHLGILLGDRLHKVTWTDVSEGVPEGIFKIVKQIGSLAEN